MEHNIVCAQYCIDVIRSVMKEHPVPQMPEGVSLQNLFQFARMHSVEAIVFRGLGELDPDDSDPVWQNWCNRAQMLLTQSIVQLAERDTVFKVMTEAGMDILPVKGCWLKEAYPQIDDRQMSDLDILIRREDREQARKIMTELGFSEENAELVTHHDGYQKPPYTAVELHLQLLSGESDHQSYYDDIWKRVKAVDTNPHLFRLSTEDEYIYYFLHMKKHMEDTGCGIRSILDCEIFRNTYPDMDKVYLQREFEKLGIVSYVQMVEQLSDCWFRSGEELPVTLKKMAEIVLWSGTYGTLENQFQNRMEKLKKKYRNPVILMVLYWSERFFRPMEEMAHDYPVLEHACFLLPVFWVVRIMKKVFTKPAALLHHVKQVYKEGMDRD